MEIVEQKISWVILVKHKQIPLQILANQKNLSPFVSKYGFISAERIQDPSAQLKAITFTSGIFRHNEVDIAIEKVSIEERRILFGIAGTSKDAAALFEEIKQYLLDLLHKNGKPLLDPILIAQESEILFKAKYSSNILVSNKVDTLANEVVDAATSTFAKASVGCITINYTLEFIQKEEILSQYRIGLTRKEFSLGNAIGYPLAEQVLFSKAPLDSDTHIKLLSSLEEKLAS